MTGTSGGSFDGSDGDEWSERLVGQPRGDRLAGENRADLDWVAGLRRLAAEVERATWAGDQLGVGVVEVGLRATLGGALAAAGAHVVALSRGVMRQHLARRDVLVQLGGAEMLCILVGGDRALVDDCLTQASDEFGRLVLGGTFSWGSAARRRGDDSAQLLARARTELAQVRARET